MSGRLVVESEEDETLDSMIGEVCLSREVGCEKLAKLSQNQIGFLVCVEWVVVLDFSS